VEIDSSHYSGDNLVCIVGCPRSGTTWLQKLLACHPHVHTGWESYLLHKYVGAQLRAWRTDLKLQAEGYLSVGMASYLTEEEFIGVLKTYMCKLLQPMVGELGPGDLFIDKTPSHALYLPEITELLPAARIIHVLRDARDVVASILASSQSWGEYWATDHPRKAAKWWVAHVEAVRTAKLTIAPGRFCEVRYEDLVASPAACLSRVSEFLNLAWDEGGIQNAISQNCLARSKGGDSTKIPLKGEFGRSSGPFVAEPDGFVRSGQVGGWKRELSWLAKLSVWIKAREAMRKAGYEWTFPI